MNSFKNNNLDNNAGLFTLTLRLVVGWTYFSAFWRRLILENKLTIDEAGYIGEKFNHFLPNALGIKPLIEYLVTNPEQLHTAMVAFTVIEAIVGLFIMLGLFTRLMSIGVFGLAMGILLGSGWLGTTCLDEWQIGVLGIATGFTLFFTGSGVFSLDNYFIRTQKSFTKKQWFLWLGSGAFTKMNLKAVVLVGSLFIFGITLFTNQYFHGGVFGKLHNKSVKPKIEITAIKHEQSLLTFDIFRVEGADVYGSFLIGIEILDKENKVLKSWTMEQLANYPAENIHNYYVAKIKTGAHSLVVPLGAKARISLNIKDIDIPEKSRLKLIDISGIEWQQPIK
ncbi:TQO small subunit DoxD [Paenimyroides aestuarii]|uniref:Quinol oxidase n=1 Tax=Paenimyroides aestuarii TaxID=2968490 RepID=A0ABY5NUU5_9FLAO|nr:TQO small subunit DoxD [Paenimyroides aestuarii]UUV22243.1 quinol oxidase [Paenimyroides aestuarii]